MLIFKAFEGFKSEIKGEDVPCNKFALILNNSPSPGVTDFSYELFEALISRDL